MQNLQYSCSPGSSQKARLLARISRRYKILSSPIELHNLRLQFTRIADPDSVLDQVAAEEDRLEKLSGRRTDSDQLHLPYWAELWDSAIGIAQHLLRRRGDLKSLSALDLGCGMGLCGAVAARLGMRVLLADLEPDALLFARLNSFDDSARVRTRRLNWKTDRLDEQFDLILGADILYERKQWDFLEPFWRAHLKAGGHVLLGEPGRQTGDQFENWIAQRRWVIQMHLEPVTTRPKPIRLFELAPR